MPESTDSILDAIDNYHQTIGSIIAFSNILSYNYGFKNIIGKKIKTSANNIVQASTYVTPDLISKNGNRGIISEVKKSFPTDPALWEQEIKQVKKYDDNLTGWLNQNDTVELHDIVLLTHHSRSNALLTFLADLIRDNKIRFERKLSILEFVRSTERQTFFNIKKVWGEMTDSDMSSRLDNCIPVNLKHILKSISKTKFYDSEPHVVHTMSILWEIHISKKPTDEERRGCARTNRTLLLNINVDEAHVDLKEKAGPSQGLPLQTEIPKREWIVKALDKFVGFGYGEKVDEDNYRIHFRNYKNMEDFISFFAEKIASTPIQRPLSAYS